MAFIGIQGPVIRDPMICTNDASIPEAESESEVTTLVLS